MPAANPIGNRIAQARRAAGLTRIELADRMGLRLWSIEQFEDFGEVSPDKLAEIAEATGKPLSWFTGEAAPDPDIVEPGVSSAATNGLERQALAALVRTAGVVTDLSRRLAGAERPMEPVEIERALVDALVDATREAASIRDEARLEAQRIVKAARRKAKRIAKEARAAGNAAHEPPPASRPSTVDGARPDDLTGLLRSALTQLERRVSGRS